MANYGVRNITTVSPPHLSGKMVLIPGFNGSGQNQAFARQRWDGADQ